MSALRSIPSRGPCVCAAWEATAARTRGWNNRERFRPGPERLCCGQLCPQQSLSC